MALLACATFIAMFPVPYFLVNSIVNRDQAILWVFETCYGVSLMCYFLSHGRNSDVLLMFSRSAGFVLAMRACIVSSCYVQQVFFSPFLDQLFKHSDGIVAVSNILLINLCLLLVVFFNNFFFPFSVPPPVPSFFTFSPSFHYLLPALLLRRQATQAWKRLFSAIFHISSPGHRNFFRYLLCHDCVQQCVMHCFGHILKCRVFGHTF